MRKDIIRDFSYEFWNFIPFYHRFMHNFFNKTSKNPLSNKLNKNKKKALMIIHYHGEMCMSHLGECIGLQKGSLTTLVDALEREGYIKRKPHENDRRKTILTITKKTIDIVKTRQENMEDYVTETFNDLKNDEIIELLNSFKKIIYIMKKI